jgi:HAD superfamily hydrolase (TIGR01549 family)
MSDKFRCVVFDMDGTLTQTNQLIFDSFNHIAEKYLGKTLTPPEIIAYFGPPEEEAVQAMIGPKNIVAAMEEYYKFYEEHHDELAQLHEGMREVLQDLRFKDVQQAIFTGKGRRTTEITLEFLEISVYFDCVITGNDVEKYKPSGEGLKKIMHRLSVAPSETLMVGDAVGDIVAARDAGVKVASVVWDSYGRDKLATLEPDHIFEYVADFHQWLMQHV